MDQLLQTEKRIERKGQRIVYITASLFAEWFMQGSEHHFRCTTGLPADAVAVRSFPKPPSGMVGEDCIVGVVFESAEWEPVREGEVIPTLMPWFERVQATESVAA